MAQPCIKDRPQIFIAFGQTDRCIVLSRCMVGITVPLLMVASCVNRTGDLDVRMEVFRYLRGNR
jgi:hypothetical protein